VVVGAGATVPGWEGKAEQAHLAHPTEEILGELVGGVNLLGTRCDLPLGELPYHAAEHALFFCESEIHLCLLCSVFAPNLQRERLGKTFILSRLLVLL
jgi:hypothetical protein